MILCASFLIASLSVRAQQNDYRWRVGLYTGVMTYYGDLNTRLFSNTTPLRKFDLGYLSYGADLELSLSQAWGMRLLYSRGQFEANDRALDWQGNLRLGEENFDRALNARTQLNDLSLLLNYYFDNETFLSRNAWITPYLTAGLGFTQFDVWGDLYRNGQRYYYWDDQTIRTVPQGSTAPEQAPVVSQDGTFETNLSELDVEEDYANQTISVPMGIGVKMRFSSRINANLEVLTRYTFTDYLDDVAGVYPTETDNPQVNYAANPSGRLAEYRGDPGGNNDWYTFVSLSVHYNFGAKPQPYKVPVIYTNPSTASQTLLAPPAPSEQRMSMRTRRFTRVTRGEAGRRDAGLLDAGRRRAMVPDSLATRFSPVDSTAAEEAMAAMPDTALPPPSDSALVSDSVLNQLQAVRQEMDTTATSGTLPDHLASDSAASLQLRPETLAGDLPEVSMPLLFSPVPTAADSQNVALKAPSRVSPKPSGVTRDTVARGGPAPQIGEPMDSVRQVPTFLSFNPLPTPIDTPQVGVARPTARTKADTTYITAPDQSNAEVEQLRRQVALLSNRLESLEGRPLATTQGRVMPTRTDTITAYDPQVQQLSVENQVLREELRALQRQMMNQPPVATSPATPAPASTTNQEIQALRQEMQQLRSQMAQQASRPTSPVTAAPANDQELQALRTELETLRRRVNSNATSNTVVAAPVPVPATSGDNTSMRLERTAEDSLRDAQIRQTEQSIADLNSRLQQMQANQGANATTDVQAEVDRLRELMNNTTLELNRLRQEQATAQTRAELARNFQKTEVFFATGSSSIDSTDARNIRQIAQLTQEYPELKVVLRGYTDQTGNAQQNQILSRKRAEAVRTALVNAGVTAEKITVEHHGADRSLGPQQYSYGRRVEIHLYTN
ncbi:DUF6089 family protein [Catalinimonas alkaloidigena]|nr:DUF6089 family protein [Catalinimonas alkaloidigena]